MFAFMVILQAQANRSTDLEARASTAAARAFPWALDLRSSRWASPSGNIVAWTWTNESPAITGGIETSPSVAKFSLGRGGTTTCLIENEVVTCATTLARQEPIYYCERAGEIILASRALLVAFMLSPRRRPELDLEALSANFSNGYNDGGFLTQRTPFAGVAMAAPNATLVASLGRLKVLDPGNAYRDFGFGQEEPSREFYRGLADLFVAGLKAHLAGSSDQIIGITGGKDSRLLAAGMKAAGIEFGTLTGGFDTDPDVIIGRRVAEFLGVAHQQTIPPRFESPFGSLLATDARGETARDLMLSDGMIFSVPNLPRYASTAQWYGTRRFDARTIVTTNGAEIWRGGYASRDFSWFQPETKLEELTRKSVTHTVTDIWARNTRYLKRDYRAKHEATVMEWLAPCIKRNMLSAAAERFYLEFEVGRKASAHTTIAHAGCPYYQPFVDPEVLRRIATLHTRFRRDHYIHYNLTKLLAPGLELLPFETKRWGFEWSAPVDESDREAWLARAPLPVTPRSYGAWPLFGAVGSDCWKRFHDELFCYRDDENIWTFLDRSALLHAFSSNEIFTPQLGSLFWVIHGLSVLMSGDWLAPQHIPESPVFARFERPWPEIYRDICTQLENVETSTLNQLSTGIAEYLSGEVAGPPGLSEARQLAVTSEETLASAQQAAGTGMQTEAASGREGDTVSWRIEVESAPDARPANSYLVLPLVRDHLPRCNIVVRFSYRADNISEGRCYLSCYTGKGRENFVGPHLIYTSEWRTADHSFAFEPAERVKRLDFLLGMPDRQASAEIRDLTIEAVPRPKPPGPSALARSAAANITKTLHDTLDSISIRHTLTASDIGVLSDAVGRDRIEPLPPDAYEDARFNSWIAETCGRRPTADAISSRLTRDREHWRVLRNCVGVSNDVRLRLFERGSGVV